MNEDVVLLSINRAVFISIMQVSVALILTYGVFKLVSWLIHRNKMLKEIKIKGRSH